MVTDRGVRRATAHRTAPTNLKNNFFFKSSTPVLFVALWSTAPIFRNKRKKIAMQNS